MGKPRRREAGSPEGEPSQENPYFSHILLCSALFCSGRRGSDLRVRTSLSLQGPPVPPAVPGRGRALPRAKGRSVIGPRLRGKRAELPSHHHQAGTGGEGGDKGDFPGWSAPLGATHPVELIPPRVALSPVCGCFVRPGITEGVGQGGDEREGGEGKGRKEGRWREKGGKRKEGGEKGEVGKGEKGRKEKEEGESEGEGRKEEKGKREEGRRKEGRKSGRGRREGEEHVARARPGPAPHLVVLVGGDGDEGGLREDMGAKGSVLGAETVVLVRFHDVEPGLVFVHGVQDDLGKGRRRGHPVGMEGE